MHRAPTDARHTQARPHNTHTRPHSPHRGTATLSVRSVATGELLVPMQTVTDSTKSCGSLVLLRCDVQPHSSITFWDAGHPDRISRTDFGGWLILEASEIVIARRAAEGDFLYWHLGLGCGVRTDFHARTVRFANGALFLSDREHLLTVPLIHSAADLATARATPPPERVPDPLPFVSARAVEVAPSEGRLELLIEEGDERGQDSLLPPLLLTAANGSYKHLYVLSD